MICNIFNQRWLSVSLNEVKVVSGLSILSEYYHGDIPRDLLDMIADTSKESLEDHAGICANLGESIAREMSSDIAFFTLDRDRAQRFVLSHANEFTGSVINALRTIGSFESIVPVKGLRIGEWFFTIDVTNFYGLSAVFKTMCRDFRKKQVRIVESDYESAYHRAVQVGLALEKSLLDSAYGEIEEWEKTLESIEKRMGYSIDRSTALIRSNLRPTINDTRDILRHNDLVRWFSINERVESIKKALSKPPKIYLDPYPMDK